MFVDYLAEQIANELVGIQNRDRLEAEIERTRRQIPDARDFERLLGKTMGYRRGVCFAIGFLTNLLGLFFVWRHYRRWPRQLRSTAVKWTAYGIAALYATLFLVPIVGAMMYPFFN